MTSLPAAYCAPGRKAVTALLLALKGEQAADIIETPAIDGPDVFLVWPRAAELPPLEMRFEPARGSRFEALARLNRWPVPPSPMVLSSVI